MTDLDEVLERFQMGGLEYGGGFANHGPMAAEALVALGHPALLTGWVDLYAPRLPPFSPGRAIAPAERAAARGDASRFADWVATYEAEIARDGVRAVLARELAALAPGLFAGAAHGLLRVAHAARAIGRGETPVRVREVAFGLGYWAGSYQTLPGEPGARPERDPIDALLTLEPVPPAARAGGAFTDAVRALDAHAPFARALASADLRDAGSDAFLSALCRAGARLYLANPEARIAYAHAVTAPSAVRLVAPWVDAATRRALGTFAYQAAMALHAVSAARAEGGPPPSAEAVAMADDVDEIRYRAACSLGEHAIKLAEACLREDAIAPARELRLAAADAAAHLQG